MAVALFSQRAGLGRSCLTCELEGRYDGRPTKGGGLGTAFVASSLDGCVAAGAVTALAGAGQVTKAGSGARRGVSERLAYRARG